MGKTKFMGQKKIHPGLLCLGGEGRDWESPGVLVENEKTSAQRTLKRKAVRGHG